MINEQLYPSELLLNADMWLLSTAVSLVLDLNINEYSSLLNEKEASKALELHQMAVGSFQAKNLNLIWDSIAYDYWVNPDEFLLWCIGKKIADESTLVDFYKDNVMKYPSMRLVDAYDKIMSFRKPHSAKISNERTLALVELKLAQKPDLTLDELVRDKQIRSIGQSINYTDFTIKKWIQEAFSQFQRPSGRPTKSSKK